MTKLSLAAQAAIDAAWGGVPSGLRDPYVVRLEQVAAAYEALAVRIMGAAEIKLDLLSIVKELRDKATELEAAQ